MSNKKNQSGKKKSIPTSPNSPSWIKQQKLHPDFETMKAGKWDEIKNFKMDPGCYVLIRVDPKKKEIGVGICDYNHQILKEFTGKTAIDLYNFIFQYDQDHRRGWFTRLDHAAYFGKELKKAEEALRTGKAYHQE